MNAQQKDLARHALGLVNGRTTSFRLHFVCGKGHVDYGRRLFPS